MFGCPAFGKKSEKHNWLLLQPNENQNKKLQIETRCDGRVLISLLLKSRVLLDNTLSTEKIFSKVGKQRLEKRP